MAKYKIFKDKNHIEVYGYDQCFTEEDIKDLWQRHKILYIAGGIVAIWVEERENFEPLIHIMREDDGTLYWKKETDQCFSVFWLDNYIKTFNELQEKIKELPY